MLARRRNIVVMRHMGRLKRDVCLYFSTSTDTVFLRSRYSSEKVCSANTLKILIFPLAVVGRLAQVVRAPC